MAEHISFRTAPSAFSNRCLMDIDLISQVAELIEGPEPLGADDVILLSTLAEAISLNEAIVPVGAYAPIEHQPLYDRGIRTADQDIMKELEKGGALDNLEHSSAGSIVAHELAALGSPQEEGVRVIMVHGSHIVLDPDFDANGEASDSHSHVVNLQPQTNPNWNEEYVRALDRYDYNSPPVILVSIEPEFESTFGEYYETDDDQSEPSAHQELAQRREVIKHLRDLERIPDATLDSVRLAPWKIIADCHGIPYISDPFYSLRDVDTVVPTNIGVDLYRRLVRLHDAYFQKIRKYLGPTYIKIPPILTLALQECRSAADLPASFIAVREEFSDFRNEATSLEVELRKASSMSDQIEIIRSIESSYEAIASSLATTKQRLLLRLFDVVKEVDPVHMVLEAADQAKDYLVEKDGLLKMPGYYALWRASVDVEQGLPHLQRIFGDRVSPEVHAEMVALQKLKGGAE